ncbi:hypothetical protein BZG35_08615 [Brevundimonas sp. LM2]|uniref:RNA polymerase sigma factor n=1 Tax=Brevundimonas sp. LM2 TaxID=1938605 RepID=UPI000983AA12|nr:RNA polymerase sigma factor [Brevundimonas sp. LM2]AQR61707.1 hypothetical protein BZG35_08615 [Brevundimonas sp. LM2]
MSDALTHAELEQVFIQARADLQRRIRHRVRCPERAADLTQDLYFKLVRLADRLPNAVEAKRYMLRMAANAGLDDVKNNQNRARLLEGLAVLYEPTVESPETLTGRRQEVRHVEAALAELTPRRRDMLRRSRILGESYAEIAAAWGLSVRTVELEIAAALRHARDRVRPEAASDAG